MRERERSVHAFNVSEQHVQRLHGELVEVGERVKRVETGELVVVSREVRENRLVHVAFHVLKERQREERVRSCLDSRRRFAGGAMQGGNCSKNRATFALAACESQRLSLPLHRESLGSESAAASKN